MEEYLQVGAVKQILDNSVTRHLVPWFIITKKEGQGEKVRLIADCREINRFFSTKHFKLDHMQNIFPVLRPGMWGAKVDLKHAYFHISLEKSLRPFVRMQVGEKLWEFQSACFGLNVLPQLFMMVMKTFQKKVGCKRIVDIHLPGRHSFIGHHKKSGAETFRHNAAGFKRQWHANKFFKIKAATQSKYSPFGFHFRLTKRTFVGSPRKTKNGQKRVGKTCHKKTP